MDYIEFDSPIELIQALLLQQPAPHSLPVDKLCAVSMMWHMYCIHLECLADVTFFKTRFFFCDQFYNHKILHGLIFVLSSIVIICVICRSSNIYVFTEDFWILLIGVICNSVLQLLMIFLSNIIQELVKQTGVSWNKRFMKSHGPINKACWYLVTTVFEFYADKKKQDDRLFRMKRRLEFFNY